MNINIVHAKIRLGIRLADKLRDPFAQMDFFSMQQRLPHKRSKSGSTITEFGPALFLLLFFAIFPMINLIFLGLIYYSCLTLNYAELNEAAKTPGSQLAATFATMETNWQNTGFGQLASGGAPPKSKVSYANMGIDAYVTVATTFTVKPFFTVPFFNGVPGLGAPWSFTVSTKKVLESVRYASL